LGTVIGPDVAGAVGVFEEFFGRAPVVTNCYLGRAFVEVEVIPMLRVGDVGAGNDVGDGVFSYDGAGLGGQCVDAAEIAEALADVVNAVGENKIVAEGIGHFGPAPADADAGVGEIGNFIVRDGNVVGVADGNADATPVFSAAIRDAVV